VPWKLVEDNIPNVNKGEEMRKYFVRIAAACLVFASLAITAKAQDPDQAIVKISHEFVIGDTTLPAGTYRLTRPDNINDRYLLLSSLENRTGVFVLPVTVDSVPADKTRFTFNQVGGQYFLTKIATAEHVFTLAVSKQAVSQAEIKSRQGSANSGVSGTD
jgi:hypothetical protein